jgi:hypothetical protein
MNQKISNIDENKYLNYKGLLIVIIIIVLTVLLLGCSTKNNFTSYKQVADYCYNKTYNIDDTCGIEKCIMLNSAEFNSDIKFTSEKSYYQCMLINCKDNQVQNIYYNTTKK